MTVWERETEKITRGAFQAFKIDKSWHRKTLLLKINLLLMWWHGKWEVTNISLGYDIATSTANITANLTIVKYWNSRAMPQSKLTRPFLYRMRLCFEQHPTDRCIKHTKNSRELYLSSERQPPHMQYFFYFIHYHPFHKISESLYKYALSSIPRIKQMMNWNLKVGRIVITIWPYIAVLIYYFSRLTYNRSAISPIFLSIWRA